MIRAVITLLLLVSVARAECPLEGDGGDPALNAAKNRTDAPRSSLLITVADLAKLHSYGSRAPRARWIASQRDRLAMLEGAAVRVEGYLVGAKREGIEGTNCHDDAARDLHVWLADTPDAGHAAALVVEVTPRLHRAGWTLEAIGELARAHRRVRITGWLLYDQEHPGDVGRSRISLWEIHPVTSIEVYRDGTWSAL